MEYCTNCGEHGDLAFCSNCGSPLGAGSRVVSASSHQPLADQARPIKRKFRNLWIGVATVVVIAVLPIIGFGTATHWTKVDVPEQLETFHSETYLTGAYDVRDNGVSPCWVGQDWTDCTNEYVDQYNAACVGVTLTWEAKGLCDGRSESIDEMKADGEAWSEVATLGDYGYLSQQQEKSTRRVSNNDYRPAVTHEAVCYFGFIGECE